MDVYILTSRLADLPVPAVRYFETIGSTNDEALQWAASGAEDGCLVVADRQTQGRGRMNRRWITQPGSALAFSLILQPRPEELPHLGLFSPLGALAISKALEPRLVETRPEIKWPNDVLLRRKKAAGILVESAWAGDRLQSLIIGIGINVKREAVPPQDQLLFPATSVEEAAAAAVDRVDLLHDILKELFTWRGRISEPAFSKEWESRLAFRGEEVRVEHQGGPPVCGIVEGIDPSGGLLLREANGNITTVMVGDVRLRLANQSDTTQS